ncbi:MAG TPA: hypothetical protein DGB97_01540, partial [Staphylococcus sp.]|nr:hypothetical protein [Staphylococcus sp.]
MLLAPLFDPSELAELLLFVLSSLLAFELLESELEALLPSVPLLSSESLVPFELESLDPLSSELLLSEFELAESPEATSSELLSESLLLSDLSSEFLSESL